PRELELGAGAGASGTELTVRRAFALGVRAAIFAERDLTLNGRLAGVRLALEQLFTALLAELFGARSELRPVVHDRASVDRLFEARQIVFELGADSLCALLARRDQIEELARATLVGFAGRRRVLGGDVVDRDARSAA